MADSIYLRVEADDGEGDYVTSFREVSPRELVSLLPIIRVVKDNRGKWPRLDGILKAYKGRLTEDQINMLNDYVPSYLELNVIHIASIDVYTVSATEELL